MPTAAVPLTPISTTLAAMTTAAATIGIIRLLLLITRNIHDQSLMTMRTDDSLLTDGRKATGRRVSGNRLAASERQIRCAAFTADGLLLLSRCRFGGRLRSGLLNLTRNYHQPLFFKFISKEIEPVAANDRSQILQFTHCRITIGYLYNGRTGLSCLFCY